MTDDPVQAIQYATQGSTLMTQGRLADAEACFREAVRLNPRYAEAHNDLANALRLQGLIAQAVASYRNALRLRPDIGMIHQNLGKALAEQGLLDEAEASLREAVRLQPMRAEIHHDLGTALQKIGRPADAIACFEQALRLKPGHEPWLSYVDSLTRAGRLDLARQQLEERWKQGLQAETKEMLATVAGLYSDLGNALRGQGWLLESESSCRQALGIEPNHAHAHNNLGAALQMQGRLGEAEASIRRALALDPGHVEAQYNLGNTLQSQNRFTEAEVSYRRALELNPDHAYSHTNLGSILQMQGRLDEAEVSFRRALKMEPRSNTVYDALLFALNYHPDKSGEEIFQAYREYDARIGKSYRETWRTHSNRRDPDRRLKIGYVSPDFWKHAVRHFLEPLLVHHDKRVVEVYAYAECPRVDAVTERYKRYVDHWAPTQGLTDEEMAGRIRADEIDILVDLAGHTAGNRLPVFARKPAPVSVSWLGYGYTTGLSAIDYFLTDDASSPPDSDALFCETPWRLATPGYVYRPADGMGEVGALPARTGGHVTFGTLTRAVRINHRTIRVWSQLLKRVRGSRLVVDSRSFREDAARDALTRMFAVQGIGREQLEIGFHSPPWDVLRTIDIGLDCFPHNSGTTLFEMLYMGVPFVTLAGRPSVGRLGSSVLEGVGHPEWIAGTDDEYVEIACAMAAELPRLAAIRARLRSELQASTLMNEPGFARKVESAYRKMWKIWCADQSPRTVRHVAR